MNYFRTFFLLIIVACFHRTLATTPGNVYLVLGSDTAIWNGMNVNQYHCYYNIDLYTDPLQNAYQVMSPDFRAQFVDSYGQPLKMTWWMMAGNIFRYASNKNVPLANIMTLYLMQKYHGNAILQNGDELSLHYHTFNWTDYNSDGVYWWNQALEFSECRNDFDLTLAQFLLEENIFPVSFRSGWHYMDNEWQNYLNELLPYSMHNDWPNVNTDTTEPLDNTYDWSQAPAEFVPYHPSPQDYQLPGDGPGWNVRSAHMYTVRYQDLMDTIFAQASQGIDQVACIWAHLPETDFLENIAIIDSLAHTAAENYPEVEFQYCTAVEAMQFWRQTSDTEGPVLTLSEHQTGTEVYFTITSDEPFFQPQPFVAVKNIYEQYSILPCTFLGPNEWQTVGTLQIDRLAKVGVAACDTVGNLTTTFIHFLPDDIYIDNQDSGYEEVSGSWTTSTQAAWGVDSRVAPVSQNDTAKVRWIPDIQQAGYYNIFIQVPGVDGASNQVTYTIRHAQGADTTYFTSELPTMDWVYIGTAYFTDQLDHYLEIMVVGESPSNPVAVADVAKFSALVRDRDIYVTPNFLNFGEVSEGDTVTVNVNVTNRGLETLTLSEVSSVHQTITLGLNLPVEIPGMGRLTLPLHFTPPNIGIITDTVLFVSDDPVKPVYKVPLTANVQSYFEIVDNEDSLNYSEEGTWYYSNAQAYGPTSRYAWLLTGASASFSITLERSGLYDLFEIVPTTQNATNYALYVVSISNVALDSVIIDQNEGSGYWVLLGRYYLPADILVEVKVLDTGQSTAGDVLRADAVKFQLIEEITAADERYDKIIPKEFKLKPNYPNPFNAVTTITYDLPLRSQVSLVIYDIIGRQVKVLINKTQEAGHQSVLWDGTNDHGVQVSSGIYFFHIQAGNFAKTHRMVLLN